MDPQVHPDPVTEGTSRALRRSAQIAYAAVTGAQVLVQLRRTQNKIIAEREEIASKALRDQIAADRAAARTLWAPALDADWLKGADLARVARAWGAALPFADATDLWHDRGAVIARGRCEGRLRELHPYGMRRYDRLRGEGRTAGDAMREAAPFFAYMPRPRDAGPAPRQPSMIEQRSHGAGQSAGGSPLEGSGGDGEVGRRPAGPRRPPRSAMLPWRQDFPVDIRDVLAAAVRNADSTTLGAPAPAPAKRKPRPKQQP